MKKFLSALLVFAAIFITACGSGGEAAYDETSQTTGRSNNTEQNTNLDELPPTVEKFDIEYNEDMRVGETQKITVSVVLSGMWPDIAPERMFTSSDESILTVDEQGNVTAISAGTAEITVRYNVLSEKITVNVCAAEPYVDYKPIIYLYPTEPTEIEVRYVNEENLLTSYPKYNGAWRVFADVDGTLIDEGGREYYALFFDEARTHDVDFKTGFYVSADGAIPFLEEKLEALGFTAREADEFIMFWLPVLERNGQSVVYFEQTAEREAECPLDITPAPDSILRVIIHIKRVDAPADIEEQEFAPFVRCGFTLVEWGGTTY